MNWLLQTLTPQHLDEAFDLEEKKLILAVPDEDERMLKLWDMRWRKEALSFYLATGWSFGAFSKVNDKDHLEGFVLAQPLLFFRNQTQNLWVEFVSQGNPTLTQFLVESAYRLGRDKHLQRVLFGEGMGLKNFLSPWNPRVLEDDILELRTTKG